MENQINKPVTRLLSLEELSLTLGMINRPDLSHVLLNSVYPDIADHQMESRLIGATNSLLACNLMTLNDKHIPQLDRSLELLVFPLAVYDRLLHLGLNSKHQKKDATVHLQNGKNFTCHTTEKGVLHRLEQDKIEKLNNYLEAFFEGFGKGVTSKYGVGKVSQGLLNRSDFDKKNAVDELVSHGFTPASATDFIDDLIDSSLRGSIVQVNANSSATAEETLKANRHILALIQGKKRSWVIDFPFDNSDLGTASLVDQKTFKEMLAALIA